MRNLPTGTVTFLFTDVERSTRLQLELGPERYADVRAEHHRVLREASARCGGVEVDTAGDGIFVAFPTASGAATASADAQRALSGVVAVRMGLHSGEPLLTDDGYAGLDVVRAARIADAAHGGQILLSDSTHTLLGAEPPLGTSMRDLGEHRLKDLGEPHRVFQLVVEGIPRDFPPLRSLASRPTNLPAHQSPLIGRADELAMLARLLAEQGRRLVTLTGPGGSGKSRLAFQAAADALDEFREGVYVVRLEELDDPDLVPGAIAVALGLLPREDVSPEAILHEYLAAKEMLVVLDSCERVLDAAPLVSRLLGGSTGVRFLATSIAPLRISQETVLPVAPLDVPSTVTARVASLQASDAVALFVERARMARPAFELTADNAEAVATVCVAVDGLPLAIELAAARLPILSPEALAARLVEPLPLLTGGSRDAPDRHRALRATIEWSYGLLDPPLQRLFDRLSVFAGGCTLDAVEAVCRPREELGVDALDGVAGLVESSMLRAGAESGAEPRFAMLETLRGYARERLSESGEAGELQRRHAEFYLGDREDTARYLDNEEARTLFARLDAEVDNVRAALTWAHEAGSELELPLAVLWQRLPKVFPAEGRRVLRRALESGADADRRLQARALAAMGGLARMQGDLEEAEASLEQSRRLYRELDDHVGELVTLARLAAVAGDRDDLEAAVGLAREHEALARRVGDAEQISWALSLLAEAALAHAEYDDARALLDEATSLVGDDDVYLLVTRSALEILDGDPRRAVAVAAHAVTRYEEERGRQSPGWWLVNLLATALAQAGETETAVRLHAAVERVREERGVSTKLGPGVLRERIFEPLVKAAGLEVTGADGSRMALDEAVELGLAAADRVRERA